MQLPTREDISPTSGLDLDERVALDHFLGKTQSEASALFFESPEYYADDLLWMGSKGFAFYFPALEPYLRSGESEGDSDIVNTIISTLKLRLVNDPASIEDCKDAVLRVLTFMDENWDRFQVDRKIYGDIENEVTGLIKEVQSLASTSK